ncbi:MFS transporter [Mesorhizobium sp. YC-39]|uniref:MFS transporter n=1 Tax=unclassified Mesorhizobium TaxID=325217 RepID=UPI0021E760DE|nr:MULTISPECIES: MFS transporter [unclassified Mesorhizobium]MCV3205614.1 MFS transporter [Mesorhizobium sp. YC-2]MCV3227987.1 MFS transporter [Mesorhizobium sp. YC-39]
MSDDIASKGTHPKATSRALSGDIVFLLAGLAALGSLSTNIIPPAFQTIGETLGVSTPELGPTLSGFFIAFALGQLVVGPLADRFGRERLVLGSLTVFVAGCLISSVASTLSHLILGRIIQALGACGLSVLSRAIARDVFEGASLARALAVVMTATAAAPGFSPLVGSVLNSLASHHPVFGS